VRVLDYIHIDSVGQYAYQGNNYIVVVHDHELGLETYQAVRCICTLSLFYLGHFPIREPL
jgi:hypothetical protein